jgi:hypothetical protein
MDKRFVIVQDKCDVSILYQLEDEGNLDIFSVNCEDEEDAKYIAEELTGIVLMLNGQDRILMEHNLSL